MKIIGNTVGMGLPKPNLMQNDPTKGDYVKGKEQFLKQAGGNNLLVVTFTDEDGTLTPSHTYDQIKEWVNNGGSAVLTDGKVWYNLATVSDSLIRFERTVIAESGALYVYYVIPMIGEMTKIESINDGATVDLDTSMTQSGKAADAKAVGDITAVSAEYDEDAKTVSFKNALGAEVFSLDLSMLSVGEVVRGELSVSVTDVSVAEGSSGTFTITLASAPNITQIVYLTSSDSTKVSVSPASLSFNADNWNEPQTVTVTALQDEDEVGDSVSITATSKNVEAKIIAVTVNDDDGYELFDGKQIVSIILAKDIVSDADAGTTTYRDRATGEEFVKDWVNYKPYPTRVQTRNGAAAYTDTQARSVLESNTTGAYTLMFIGTTPWGASGPGAGLFNGVSPSFYNYYGPNGWDTMAITMDKMYYTTVDGTQAETSIAKTDLALLKSQLPSWSQHIAAFSFNADGTITAIIDNIEAYKAPAPDNFAKWDWNLDGWSWNYLRYNTMTSYGNIIVNDALTAEDIDKFYTKYLSVNFTSGQTD